MLAQKPKETPYIAIFKTGSGEEFIGKVVEETMLSYNVLSPLCMVATDKGFQFAPFMMMANGEEPVSIPKPIITGRPDKKLEAQYEQILSPIALPGRI
jgi:hypothetical protein